MEYAVRLKYINAACIVGGRVSSFSLGLVERTQLSNIIALLRLYIHGLQTTYKSANGYLSQTFLESNMNRRISVPMSSHPTYTILWR